MLGDWIFISGNEIIPVSGNHNILTDCVVSPKQNATEGNIKADSYDFRNVKNTQKCDC